MSLAATSKGTKRSRLVEIAQLEQDARRHIPGFRNLTGLEQRRLVRSIHARHGRAALGMIGKP